MTNVTAVIVLGALGVCATNLCAQEPESIAIIGTGDLGDSLGPKLAMSGHRIIYGSRDPARESAKALVKRTGAGASVTTQKKAADAADIVLLAVPWPPMEQVAQNLGDLDGKIVVDLSFPYVQGNDGYLDSMVETSSAEMIQAWNPDARVVKLSLPGSFLIDDPLALGHRADGLIAADDREAKEIVAKLLAEIGLVPFDAGPLRYSRYLEAQGMLYMVPLLQGRKEGWEIFVHRTSFWPCVSDVASWYERPVVDRDDLAQFPKPETPPTPCSSYPPRP